MNLVCSSQNGREATILFSPSRKHLASKEVNPDCCIHCNSLSRPTVPLAITVKEEENQVGYSGPGMDLDLENANENANDDFDGRPPRRIVKDKTRFLGPTVKMPAKYCDKHQEDSELGHYIHKKCLKEFEENNPVRCPRCVDLEQRLNILSESEVGSRPRYCEATLGGFVASSKIEAVVNRYKAIPKHDKVWCC